MLELFLTAKVVSSPNVRFKSDLEAAKNRYIKKHGRIDRTTGSMKSHSFVLQFLQNIESVMAKTIAADSDAVSIVDTGGTARSINTYTFFGSGNSRNCYGLYSWEAPATITTYGILAGTGTTAPAANDNAMETLIAHGVGAGQLYYGGTGTAGTVVSGSNCDLTISRLLGNTSGGTITIREVGLAVGMQGGSSTYYYFLQAHDAVNQAVASGETAIILYTLRTTV